MGSLRRTADGASLAEIERIYRTRFAEFVRVATAVCHRSDVAGEAVHEAFVNLVKGRDAFRGDGPLEAWVWRAVVTSAIKTRRRDERRDAVRNLREFSLDKPGPVEDVDGPVREAIRLLPERQRLIVFLRYYADLDYSTIASILQLTTGTVGAALNAAHRSLRSHLEEVRL